jgi:hypothetical protein
VLREKVVISDAILLEYGSWTVFESINTPPLPTNFQEISRE